MDKALLMAFTKAGTMLGISEKTARNWDSAGKFPVPTFLIGSRRMVRTQDLEKFVEELGGAMLKNEASPAGSLLAAGQKKRRGRPRKDGATNGQSRRNAQ
jgi:hypothetical protein